MPTQPQRAGRHVIGSGLLFGAILGLLGAGNVLLQWAVGAYHVVAQTTNGFTSVNLNDNSVVSALGCVVFLMMLALTFVAGLVSARGSGRIRSGALAGLLTGSLGGLIGGLAKVLIIAMLVVPGVQIPDDVSMSLTQVQMLVVGIAVGTALIGLLLDIGFGTGMGALGGLIGANTYRKAMSHPGASDYPNYPGYPSSVGMPAQPGSVPQQEWPYPNPPLPPQ